MYFSYLISVDTFEYLAVLNEKQVGISPLSLLDMKVEVVFMTCSDVENNDSLLIV